MSSARRRASRFSFVLSLVTGALVAAGGACEKSPAPGGTGAGAGPAPSASAAVGASDAATATAGQARGAGAAPAAEQPATWQGTYKSTAGTLYIPDAKDWKGVRYNVKDVPEGIGEGAVTLRVDPSSGRVLGEVDGPLGPATVDGVSRDGKVTASLRRKDPADHGFTGTLVGTLAGSRGEGTLSVSTGEASAIRTATFVVTPSAAR